MFKGHDLNKLNTADELCAVKLVERNKIYSEPLLIDLFKNEKLALTTLQGNYVLNSRDVFEEKDYIYNIGPLCNGGDLRKLLNKRHGKPLPEKEARVIFRQMLLGMQEMQKHHFVHRDLKPENTFINDNVFKIADFGFCQVCKPGQTMDF